MSNLKEISKDLRREIVDLHTYSATSHIGSSLSCLDILLVLYYKILNIDASNPNDPKRDRFILSKGHSAPALYSVLAHKGFFDKKILEEYGKEGSVLFEHPEKNTVPGIEATTGSLGHGLPIGLGIAYASKLSNLEFKVFVLISDGECQEGSVWEAVMLASKLNLSNLVCIVDYNNLQGYGRTDEIQSDAKIVGRFTSSGWNCIEVNGHDFEQLEDAFNLATSSGTTPTLILARTIKGKGIPQIEDKLEWHYKSPTLEQSKEFKKEIDEI